MTPRATLRDLLANDSSAAAARLKYSYPNIPPPKPVARQRREGIDRYAMLRAWLQKRLAAKRDLVVFDVFVDSIPPALAEGKSRGVLSLIAVQALRKARYKPLGRFKDVPGRHHQGAYLWAIKLIERDGLPPFTIERVQRYVPPSQRASEPGLQWLRDHPPELPTLAYAPDIAALIPEEFGGYPGQRVRCAMRYLIERGAVHLGEHMTDQGRRKLWATRDIERLQLMKPRERVQEFFGRVPYRRGEP